MKFCRPAVLFFLCMYVIPALKAEVIPVALKCGHKTAPLGISGDKLLFGWQIAGAARGYIQSAYQVLVSSSPATLHPGKADTWDSGKIISSSNFLVPYGGAPPEPATKYYWKVRVWDQSGKVSAWSGIAEFGTDLPGQDAWGNAKWIGAEVLPDSMKVVPGVHGSGDKLGDKAVERAVIPCFRKSFSLEKPLEQAFVFVSGLGQYEFHLNGKKIGDDFLTPGWTDYADRCLYNTYDVTKQLRQGENVLGAIVGTGFFYLNRERYRKLVAAWGLPMLRVKLILKFTDGSSREITTDQSWKWAPSPVVFTSIYGGEDYDARLEQPGWDRPGFNDDHWKKALPASGPGGEMQSQQEYPLQVMDTIETRSVTRLAAGKFLYDFGQNASGIVRLKIKGSRGDTVRITPAELLDEEGLPTQQASGGPYYFEYILNGNDAPEEWMPRFTYYGFRYALIEGAVPAGESRGIEPPGKRPGAQLLSLQMLHTRNSAPSAGSFACSNPLFNRIYDLINWSIRSNLASVTTDCPHREKLGWLEQAHLTGGSIRYNYDILHLYGKIVDDMIDSRLPNGLVPDIAPEYVIFEDGFRDSPEWGSASVIIPWYLYRWYGDKSILRKAYGMMKDYVDYLGTRSEGHIVSHGLGDWFDLGPEPPGPSQLTPIALTATAIYYYDADILSRSAEVLGQEADARRYGELAAAIKKAFNQRFFNSSTGVYATGSQTSYAMPLFTGLVEEKYREAVFQNLVDSIHAGNNALTAGDVGYRYLVRALEKGGAAQLLYEMNNRNDVPGYGYQIRHGATALTESWPALKYVSNNHMMLGHLMEWLYSGLAGISQQESSTGFRKIKIAPQPVEGIDWAEASYASIAGRITVHWEKTAGKFRLKTTIPPNTEAEIYLPEGKIEDVRESGKQVQGSSWLKNTEVRDGNLVMTVLSGSYDLEVPF